MKKERVFMEWNEKMDLIIEYVETHLQRTEEPLNPEEVAAIAECSFDFFQKVFAYMNKISFSDYVRARKLTLAGYDVKSTKMRVIDISYKYNYHSPTSFSKAFHQFHDVSPTKAREKQATLRIVPKMTFTQSITPTWRLKKQQSFRLIGVKTKISCVDHAHYKKIPEFWNECQKNGLYSTLISLDEGTPKGVFGLFGYFDEQSMEIDYFIMVESQAALSEQFCEIIIPEVTWAVFDCVGRVPESIHKGWNFLNEEWLLAYPFKHAPCPELEWYSDGNSYSENYLSQIWIPIEEEKQ